MIALPIIATALLSFLAVGLCAALLLDDDKLLAAVCLISTIYCIIVQWICYFH